MNRIFAFIFMLSLPFLHTKEKAEINTMLDKSFDYCNTIQSNYSTVDKVYRSADFANVCAFAGLPATYDSARILRLNGIRNQTSFLNSCLDSVKENAIKMGDDKIKQEAENALRIVRHMKELLTSAYQTRSIERYDMCTQQILDSNTALMKKLHEIQSMVK